VNSTVLTQPDAFHRPTDHLATRSPGAIYCNDARPPHGQSPLQLDTVVPGGDLATISNREPMGYTSLARFACWAASGPHRSTPIRELMCLGPETPERFDEWQLNRTDPSALSLTQTLKTCTLGDDSAPWCDAGSSPGSE
jgi:hypothetical protein